jgi:S1-C subfamily serine protease
LIIIITSVAALYIYNYTRPPAQYITQRDFNVAVGRALASATPLPFYASKVYDKIRPSLVRVEGIVTGEEEKNGTQVGTGVIIDDRGTILTCLHIVENTTAVSVTFSDGSESAALVMIAQAENDLAVLVPEIIPDDIKPAVLAGTAGLKIGDEVVAVGNPYGITNSLSAGVVSGLGRNIESPKTGRVMNNLIQFDAAVNPGNSGGPLLNRDGEVVGIVASLLNPTEQDFFIGIGFAVTMETAGGVAGVPPL